MQEKKLKGLGKLHYIFFLLKPYWKYGKALMVVTIVMAAVFQPLATYLETILPKKAIDLVMAGAQRKNILLTIGLYTMGIALVAVAQRLINMAYSNFTRLKIRNRILNEVNEKALYTDFKYYDNPDFFTKFVFAQEQFSDQADRIMTLFPRLLEGVVTIAAMGALIALTGPVLLGVTLFFVVINTAIGLSTLKPQADHQVMFTSIFRPLEYVNRTLKQKENAAELRSSGAGLKLLHTINTVLERFHPAYKSYMKKTLPFLLAKELIMPIQTACVLVYVVLFVIDGDTSKIGLYASLTIASAALSFNMGRVFSTINDILEQTLYGERIAAFFEAKSEIEPITPGKVSPPEGVYDVELRDVSFRYENAKFGIEHLNLLIKPGQRIAIVGENGAGKTTLTKLLLRLYDVSGGELLINGRNIKDFDVHALRLHIGIAFQDVRVLAMSLRDNLTVYHTVPDEKLMDVIHKLGLDGVVEKAGIDNANGSALDRMVSREFTEHGIVLSGGEAQRLSLARLFTGPFGLLVLDEPTAALDPLAEYKLMQIIMDASNTATTIMVAHRLSTVRNFDVIYHMDMGKIIESGTHNELMAARGKYYEMFTKQAENYQCSESEPVI